MIYQFLPNVLKQLTINTIAFLVSVYCVHAVHAIVKIEKKLAKFKAIDFLK